MSKEELELEGVFLIKASTEDVFFNRRSKFFEVTGFNDFGMDSYEEDDEGGIWKLIAVATTDLHTLKDQMAKMKKYSWFFDRDCTIMHEGEYLLCDGKWKGETK